MVVPTFNWITNTLRSRFLLCIFCPLLISTTSVQANEYRDVGLPISKIYEPAEHMGSNQIWWMEQGQNGLIYAATSNGITVWDGENWTEYRHLHNNFIAHLKLWKDGRIYAGSPNDIGYFEADDNGELIYQSLVSEWTEEQRQFGLVFSTAANDKGVVFVTMERVFFWDGNELVEIPNADPGRHFIFNIGDDFYYKAHKNPHLSRLTINPSNQDERFTVTTSHPLPLKARPRFIGVNRQGEFWMITRQKGLYVEKNGVLEKRLEGKDLGEDTRIYHGIQTSDGYYYLGAIDDGLVIVNEQFEVLRHYKEKDGLGLSSIFSVMEDRQNNIWLSGSPNIVRMLPPHKVSRFVIGSKSNNITSITQANGKITLSGNGIYQMQASEGLSTPSFTLISNDRGMSMEAIENNGYILMGNARGVYGRPVNAPDQPFELIAEMRYTYHFATDPLTETLYVTSHSGLFRLRFEQGGWESDLIEGTTDEIQSVMFSSDGVLWIGSSQQQLYRISGLQSGTTTPKIDVFSEKDGLPSGLITPKRLGDDVVIASETGILAYNPDSSPAFNHIPGFPDSLSKNTEVKTLVRELPSEQQAERLWFISSEDVGYEEKLDNGQWQLHTNLFRYLPPMDVEDLLVTGDNIAWSPMVSGELYRVNVQNASEVPAQAPLNVRFVRDLDTREAIKGGYSTSNFPLLDQTSNSLRIHYALADNTTQTQPVYRHRLVGSNNETWSDWTQETYQDYFELSGGEFRFEIEGKDAFGRVSREHIEYRVLPPWYLSRTAIASYVISGIIILLLTAWISQRWRTRKLKERNLLLEQTVAERTQEVQAKVSELEEQQILKDRFFANVSHEFRTPLTLTIGPLETAVSSHDKALVPEVKSLIDTALSNANKMLALVGQVLDMNRLEAGKFPLHVSQNDLAELMRNLATRFGSWAQQHQQSITCEGCADPCLVWFDLDQMDKSLSNLLSNAIKYSGDGSQIILKLTNHSDRVTIDVIDNGVGLSEEAKSHVFERFYQEKRSESVSEPGTGIGLAMVKELIELHHGTITLTSTKNEGCQFSINLARGNDHFSSEQLIEPIADSSAQPSPDTDAPILTSEQSEDDKTTLLVVDDNAELLNFISLRLSANYRILQASNGEQAFSIACESLPDLIVSDVMMPKMNGLELTEKLKQTPATRTIPVILLTAKSTKRETVEGFTSGADDYLTKPFDTSELIMRVNAQINARKVIRDNLAVEESAEIAGVNANDPFLAQLNKQVMAHISDPRFNVEMLAKLMHMSRDTLTRKCNKTINQSPLAYIRHVRMHHAAVLLKNDSISVSEVAYGLGFESLAYFSRTFKKHTGKTPTEYTLAFQTV